MEMDWHLRIAWWLLVAVLLVSALTLEEVSHRSRRVGWLSSSGGSWYTGDHGSSSTQSEDRDHQDTQTIKHDTQSGCGSKAADYHQQLPYNPNYTIHQLSYLGSFSVGGGYYGYQQDYPSSQGFGHYPSRGLQWSPPGYKSSCSVMPGLFSNYGSRGSLRLSSYQSIPFGYSKNFFRPSFPTVVSLPVTHYHYPSNIASRFWGCDCYFEETTAVCKYRLENEVIPWCVSSSVTALFIQSEEVDWLSGDAFRHVPHLEYINITDTVLSSLPGNLFRYTQNLKHLLVQKNPDLRSLDSDIFNGAINLEDVILDRNDISSLERDMFTYLTNVKRLNLAYNKIRILPEGIFRNNRELQELVLSGNPLRISSDTPRDLLTNNVKLRVLLMRNCRLEGLPNGLLRNALSLEWLDLSHNKISKFPSEFIQGCAKLAYLGIAYNKLQTLGSDVLQQRGGSLATLDLEGNTWYCDCAILPLAAWTTLRKDAVPGQPKCSSLYYIEKVPLRRWFLSEDAMKCDSAISSLRTDLNRILSVARGIAKKGPNFFANLLPVSDNEVNFTATNYFFYATAARTDAEVHSVVWHWARFLEKVLDRRHRRHVELVAKDGINQIVLDRTELFRSKLDKKNLFNFYLDFMMDPLATTTTKPPVARPIEYPLRSKGFEPLVNFSYIMNNVPENMVKIIDNGVEEELKILFGVINGTNASSLSTTPDTATTLDFTGLKKLNDTVQTVAGLRSELREVLATLLLAIDRAKWDAAEQDFMEEEEKKAQKPPQKPALIPSHSAGSRVLLQPSQTLIVAFLTLLAHTTA